MPIVESRESKTRSKEGILPSFQISKQKGVSRQNIFPDFLWLGRHTRHLHLWSSFRPFPRALSICFHVICPVLRAPSVSSVHTRRCSHQCSPPWLRISLRSRAQSSRRASRARTRSAEQALANLPVGPSAAARWPGHLRADGNGGITEELN